MGVMLCVGLWAHAGREADLIAYEDRVLAMLGEHGGRLVQRLRTEGAGEDPFEIHVLAFDSEDGLAAYLSDDRREALTGERDVAIARVSVLRVEAV